MKGEDGMKQIKYWIVIFLISACMVLPVAGLAIIVLRKGSPYSFVLAAVLIGTGIIFPKILAPLKTKYRQEVEYDEFGRSKTKGSYEQLSRKEREMIDLQKTADMERVMNSADMKKRIHKGSDNPQQDMDALVGLLPVKQKMKEMIARMEFESANRKKVQKSRNSTNNIDSMSGRHMVFYGSPGTGKTTVARILTGFLYQYGYIKKNKCVEIDGNFLKAGPDTALKTELTVREALDGVLFIDEAYSLNDDPYAGSAAITELIKQMEDRRDRFILILAGYTNEMKALLQQNPGFDSRIKEYLDFPDYSSEEMKQIFSGMANAQGYVVGEDAMDNFAERISRERRLPSFGNARTARNVLDESIDKHAFNFVNGSLDKDDKFRLRAVDVSRNIKRNNF